MQTHAWAAPYDLRVHQKRPLCSTGLALGHAQCAQHGMTARVAQQPNLFSNIDNNKIYYLVRIENFDQISVLLADYL